MKQGLAERGRQKSTESSSQTARSGTPGGAAVQRRGVWIQTVTSQASVLVSQSVSQSVSRMSWNAVGCTSRLTPSCCLLVGPHLSETFGSIAVVAVTSTMQPIRSDFNYNCRTSGSSSLGTFLLLPLLLWNCVIVTVSEDVCTAHNIV